MQNKIKLVLERIMRFRSPSIGFTNAWFAGYGSTVPAMAGSYLTLMLAYVGLWAIINATHRRYDLRLPARAMPFVASALFCVFAYTVTGLLAENRERLFYKLQTFALWIALPFLIARFRGFEPLRAWPMILRYAPLGSLAGLIAFFISGMDAGGAGNPNVFGMAASMLGMLSLTGVISSSDRQKLLGFCGYLIAVIAVAVSETRTMLPPMLVLPVVAVVMNGGVARKWVVLGGGLLVVILVCLSPMIVGQFRSAIDDLRNFGVSDVPTPVGIRLALWIAAWKAIVAEPWLGYGLQNKMDVVYSLNETNMKIPSFSHVHNEYLDALVAGGIPALIGLLGVLLTPLWMLGRGQASRQRDFVIVATVFLFATKSLSGNFLTHDLIVSLYLFAMTFAAATDPRLDDIVFWKGRSGTAQPGIQTASIVGEG